MVDTPAQVRQAAQAGSLMELSATDRAGVVRQALSDGVVSYKELDDLRTAQSELRRSFADNLDSGGAGDLRSIAHELQTRANDAYVRRDMGEYRALTNVARQARALASTDAQLTRAIDELETARAGQGTLETIRADVRSFFGLADE